MVEFLLLERREVRIRCRMGRRGSEGENLYLVLWRISLRGPDVTRIDWAIYSTAMTVLNGLEAEAVSQSRIRTLHLHRVCSQHSRSQCMRRLIVLIRKNDYGKKARMGQGTRTR